MSAYPPPNSPFILDPDQSGCQTAERKFILTSPISFPSTKATPKPCQTFSGDFLTIIPMGGPSAPVLVMLRDGLHWDGPAFKGADIASAYHDAIYNCAEAIAAAWGWTVAIVIRWANELFNEIMDALDTDWAVRETCYRLVAVAGVDYHEAKRDGVWNWLSRLFGDRLSSPAPRIGSDRS